MKIHGKTSFLHPFAECLLLNGIGIQGGGGVDRSVIQTLVGSEPRYLIFERRLRGGGLKLCVRISDPLASRQEVPRGGERMDCLPALQRRLFEGGFEPGRMSRRSFVYRSWDQQVFHWQFKTKLQLAVEMVLWFVSQLRTLGVSVKLWVVADGAYGNKEFIKPLIKRDVVVFSRLRHDAKLFGLPPERKPRQPGEKGKRGRHPTYGKNRISLAKRAADKRGWLAMTFNNRGRQSQCEYKEFLATSKMVGGRIRVVIVRHSAKSWSPYFCTDPNVTAQEIIEMISQRWAIEEQFHDVKEVWGAGQQQVRNVWSNIGCWHLSGWMFTMIELACWDMPQEELVDRSGRPWDNASRRPSHADRRRALSQEMLRKQFLSDPPATADTQKFT